MFCINHQLRILTCTLAAIVSLTQTSFSSEGLKDNAQAIAALKDIDAISDKDILLARELGDGHILSLNLNGKDISRVLPHIGGLKRLKQLQINVRDYSLDELATLREIQSLRTLKIYCTDNQLQAIAGLKNLEELDCPKNGITDDSLKHLSDMKKLSKLSLVGNPISGKGFNHLVGFSELKELEAQRTQFVDDSISHVVSNFPNLSKINLRGTQVTIEGMLELSKLLFLVDPGLPPGLSFIDIGSLPKEQRQDAIRKQQLAKRDFIFEYSKRYLESKEKARAAGKEVPPDDNRPFAEAISLEELNVALEE